ncbi:MULTISPECIES: DUF6221 family protein [Streptomyces]|uniref:Uncharacterized protein n=1 Tax=Streptomyces dengpaensis TaxID=2049881 RepID=A0ABN5IA15_9ACTN|nr:MULTISPECIES: DUF6221 family protein [Streptomyces]AVH60035.1 hypothetical protein C4B68_34355 [Streptomyces dengpaensis]PIB09674.1 hypothetical protein B1C81_11035 [Streptomyces sp. HG99]
MELVDFLRARLDEDEALAREAPKGPWHIGNAVDPTQPCNVHTFPGARPVADGLNWLVAEHIARHDPARVLAEVDVKRQLIARGGPFCTSDCDEPGNEPMDPDTNWTTPLEHHLDCAAYEAAKLMALPYADHPDFDPAWLED